MLPFDPIYNCVGDEEAKQRRISHFDWETTLPQQAIGFRLEIILRGADKTPTEPPHS